MSIRFTFFAAFCFILTAAPVSLADTAQPAAAPEKLLCGTRVNDWCPSPPNDPCGEHKNAIECEKDSRCEGLPYVGESVVACEMNLRCFSSNCPTVGCVSACETLPSDLCLKTAERCEPYEDNKCRRKFPCARSFKIADRAD